MQWNAEQAKHTFASDEFANIGAAGNGDQPQWPQQQLPPPAYTPASAPPDYDEGQYVGALQYGAPVHYVSAPSAAGFGQAVASQNVQFNMVGSVTPPTTVIITQTAPVVESPPSYLGWSIFNFLCCFWPLGLVAIIYSVKVGSASNQNDAKRHSLTARNLNIAATTIAPIIAIIVVSAVMGTSATGVRYQQSYYAPVYYSNGYVYAPEYYSSGYSYYFTYLMYYTYYTTYSYEVYSSYYGILGVTYYSYIAIGYTSEIASRYAIDSYYEYRAVAYYG